MARESKPSDPPIALSKMSIEMRIELPVSSHEVPRGGMSSICSSAVKRIGTVQPLRPIDLE